MVSCTCHVRVHYRYGDEPQCGKLLLGSQGTDGYAEVEGSDQAELLLKPGLPRIPLAPLGLVGSAIYWISGSSIIGFDLVIWEQSDVP